MPVVGNFAGPKALRAVGQYLRDHGATVTAFYLSNVEQYLQQDGIWTSFCANVASLPLDERSTFIRSRPGRRRRPSGGLVNNARLDAGRDQGVRRLGAQPPAQRRRQNDAMTRRRACWLAGLDRSPLAFGRVGVELGAAAKPPHTLPGTADRRGVLALSATFSEPDGDLSLRQLRLERGPVFSSSFPTSSARTTPGGVYLGVGPEQNFTYIAATRPRMAFILDIRRGNLQEHLLYKALIELSADRAEFLSRLFSRPRPAGLTAQSTPEALFAAYRAAAPSDELYRANLKAVLAHLTTTHGFRAGSSRLRGHRLRLPDGVLYRGARARVLADRTAGGWATRRATPI